MYIRPKLCITQNYYMCYNLKQPEVLLDDFIATNVLMCMYTMLCKYVVYYIFAWAGSQNANKFGHCHRNCPKKVEKSDLGYTGIKNMPPPQKER